MVAYVQLAQVESTPDGNTPLQTALIQIAVPVCFF
jgi:hypothetical protein